MLLLALLAGLTGAAHAGFPVGSEAQFARDLGSIERAGWFGDLFKDPVPSKIYSAQELAAMEADQTAARDGDSIYFIDSGYVYRIDKGADAPAYLSASSKVHSLLIYKRTLVALRATGYIYLWNAEKRTWIDIGNSAEQILTAGSDLLARTRNSELWVYKGAPGPIDITWILVPIITPGPNNTLSTSFVMTPVVAGHKIAFDDSGLKDVERLEPAGDDVAVRFKDGSKTLYHDLAKK